MTGTPEIKRRKMAASELVKELQRLAEKTEFVLEAKGLLTAALLLQSGINKGHIK